MRVDVYIYQGDHGLLVCVLLAPCSVLPDSAEVKVPVFLTIQPSQDARTIEVTSRILQGGVKCDVLP